jgi:hypothetical protein
MVLGTHGRHPSHRGTIGTTAHWRRRTGPCLCPCTCAATIHHARHHTHQLDHRQRCITHSIATNNIASNATRGACTPNSIVSATPGACTTTTIVSNAAHSIRHNQAMPSQRSTHTQGTLFANHNLSQRSTHTRKSDYSIAIFRRISQRSKCMCCRLHKSAT